MAMEITNNYNSYATNYADGTKKADSAKEGGVTTNTVELKTPTGGTKTEQIKTGYSNVNDYSKYLQGKYSYMNTGTSSMQGIPTTVSVSGAFLKKCMNDPEKAKYLEENLAAIHDCVSYAKSHAMGTLTNIEYRIDANGNITGISSGTNDPDGKIARENAERKAKEKREAEKKAADKRAEKKAMEERTAKRRAEKEQAEERIVEAGTDEVRISVTGNSIESVTKSVMSAISANVGAGVAGFDVKA